MDQRAPGRRIRRSTEMWFLFVALLVVGGTGALAAAQNRSATASQQGQPAATTKTDSLRVTGLHCGECAKKVEKAGRKIDGVTDIKVSHETSKAEVTYEPAKTSPERIAEAITKTTPFRAEVPRKP
jgi:copper chaperone CopZ